MPHQGAACVGSESGTRRGVTTAYGWVRFRKKTGRNSEVKADMRGSGDPAQTNIIAGRGALWPHGGRTAGGRAANHFDLQRKGYRICPPNRRKST